MKCGHPLLDRPGPQGFVVSLPAASASSYAGSIQQLHRGEVHILGHDVTTPEGMMEVGMKRRGSKRSIKAKSKLIPIRVQWKLVDPTFPDLLGHHLRYKCSDWSGQGLYLITTI